MVQPSIFHHSNLADPKVIGRVGRKLGNSWIWEPFKAGVETVGKSELCPTTFLQV